MVGSAPGVQGAVRGPRPVVVTVSLLFLVGLKESLYFGYSCSRLGEKVLDRRQQPALQHASQQGTRLPVHTRFGKSP